MIGIYKITNLKNGKVYIGQSVSIESRLTEHRKTAYSKNRRGYDYPLYRAIRKNGLHNFQFEIIEKCPKAKLDEREKYWIRYYNCLVPVGYNQTTGGSIRGKPTVLDWKKANAIIALLQKGEKTQLEIAEMFNVSQRLISYINYGKCWVVDGLKYPIRKPHFSCSNKAKEKTKRVLNQYCIDCNVAISPTAQRCAQCEKIRRRKTTRPNRETLKQLIRIKSFLALGREYNVSDNAIRKWCKQYQLPFRKADINKYTDAEWQKI